MARTNPQSAGELGARSGIQGVLEDDVDEVLRGTFFATSPTDRPGPAKVRPGHYKVICISLYNEDLDHLDAVVQELKRRGHTRANRSAVLREAMKQFDPSKVRRGF